MIQLILSKPRPRAKGHMHENSKGTTPQERTTLNTVWINGNPMQLVTLHVTGALKPELRCRRAKIGANKRTV
jgi:hypothetical protein